MGSHLPPSPTNTPHPFSRLLSSARTCTPGRSPGFTLVEILVVIVIIAILAALIFPALAGVQKQNRQMSSLSNLRQWGAGFMMSVGDNDNEMPSDGGRTVDLQDETAWYNRIPEKIKIPSLKDSRDSDLPKLGVKSLWVNPEVPAAAADGNIPFCYGYNDYLSSSQEKNLRLTRVQFPSKTILMGEKVADASPVLNPENIKAWFGSAKPTEPDAICNLLFIDGHVEGTKYSVYTQPKALQAGTEDELREVPLTWLPYLGAKAQ